MILSKKMIMCISILVIVGSFIGCGSSNSAAAKKDPKETINSSSEYKDPNSIEAKDVFGYDTFGWKETTLQAGYFKFTYPTTIQLLGVGNENEKPFRVIGFETNNSGITVFYPEGGGKPRLVHCDYKIIDNK